MAKLRNKETGVVKDIEKEFEASMYLGTGEWELVNEKKETKSSKAPIISTESNKEENKND